MPKTSTGSTTSLNVRIHATTKERPIDLLPKEQLCPLAEVASYELAVPVIRKVDSEGFVQFQRSRYSVPPHCGKTVTIQQQERRITIQCDQLIIAEHEIASRPDSCVALPEHLQALWKQSVENSRAPLPSWQIRFNQAVVSTPLSVYQEVA